MKDKHSYRAIREGLRARSAYKLKELNNKYEFLAGANHILDLGSWPGGWSVVAAEFAPVTAVDLSAMEPVKNCTFIKGNLFVDEIVAQLPKADVVLSDAAPKTTGDSRDEYNSHLLCNRILEIALMKLRVHGTFICKMFQNEYFDEFVTEVRTHFDFVKTTKPPTSRGKSKEMYIVAMDFYGAPYKKVSERE